MKNDTLFDFCRDIVFALFFIRAISFDSPGYGYWVKVTEDTELEIS